MMFVDRVAADLQAAMQVGDAHGPRASGSRQRRWDHGPWASGATSPRDLGKVMKMVMERVKGQADGKLVNQLVGQALTQGGSS